MSDREEIEGLRQELAAANQEIERLRGLLGFGSDSSASSAGWEPTLFRDEASLPSVDEASPNAVKVELIRTLFEGRPDVYAALGEFQLGQGRLVPGSEGRMAARRGVEVSPVPAIDR